MSKVKKNKINDVTKKIDYKIKWKETKENLLIQLKESLQQIEIHTTKATKIRGVVEVNDQMFSDKENYES